MANDYLYFVAFSYSGRGAAGFANTSISANKLIDSHEMVREIERSILECPGTAYGNVVLLSWQLLGSPTP